LNHERHLECAMIIGVPKEIKDREHRVAMTPAGVQGLTARGHQVLIERGAGQGAGMGDEEDAAVGAEVVPRAPALYARAEMICKVKEPQPSEYTSLRAGQILFAFLHLAPEFELTRSLLERQVVGIAYETVETDDGRNPLREPMSEIAGRMAIPIAATYLSSPGGGRGVLLSGIAGVPPATVTILGGGIVGFHAAKMAAGMGAWVYLLDVDVSRMRSLAALPTSASSRRLRPGDRPRLPCLPPSWRRESRRCHRRGWSRWPVALRQYRSGARRSLRRGWRGRWRRWGSPCGRRSRSSAPAAVCDHHLSPPFRRRSPRPVARGGCGSARIRGRGGGRQRESGRPGETCTRSVEAPSPCRSFRPWRRGRPHGGQPLGPPRRTPRPPCRRPVPRPAR